MDKESFYKILISRTPEELNQFLTNKGKRKMVNGIIYLSKEDEINDKRKLGIYKEKEQ